MIELNKKLKDLLDLGAANDQCTTDVAREVCRKEAQHILIGLIEDAYEKGYKDAESNVYKSYE